METAQTADYALQVLIELQERDGQTAAELGSRLGLNRSVVQRIIVTLHRRAMLTRTQDGRYWLGPGLIELGRRLPHELAATARTLLRKLAELTTEMVVLAVPDGDEALVVARRSGNRGPLRIEYSVGFRHSLTRGASGLAILAFQDEAAGAASSDPELREELEKVRAAGYSRTEGQLREYMVALAAPVLAGQLGVIASLAVIAPSVRAERLDGFVGPVREAAAELGKAYVREHAPSMPAGEGAAP